MTIKTQKDKDVEFQSGSSNIPLIDILQFKIVYWGPGESGKTTNYFRLREKFDGVKLNRGISIETTDGRTLWQDSIRLSFFLVIGNSKFNIITQIVTCTGQERFLSTREYVLDGADGVIFVADSNPDLLEQNKRSFRELVSFATPNRIPYLIQLNKRDLPNAIPIDEFKNQLDLPKFEHYEDGTKVVYPTIATEGRNVRECFEDLMTQIIYNYFLKLAGI
jgi:signal recognition particle receptor subunit beta